MAVVVDRAFFDSIGAMDKVEDLSNADVAWFIVRFEEIEGQTQASGLVARAVSRIGSSLSS